MDLASLDNERRAARWEKGTKIGEGTFANVYKATERSTGRKVAIKKIKVGEMKDGLDMTALREVKFLQELHHPNIIGLLDVFSVKQNINLVLEFLDTDLEAVIRDKQLIFQNGDIKSWMAMSLRGLEYIHRHGVLHRVLRMISFVGQSANDPASKTPSLFARLLSGIGYGPLTVQDLKPNNLLISSDGELKIADFGLAREYAEAGNRMTCQVITRWYRPPELLWGSRHYSSAVDIWSIGTIFVELILRVPFLAGETDIDQLKKTFHAMGSPTEDNWPGHTKLPDYHEVSGYPSTTWWTMISSIGREGQDLARHLLTYDPSGRPSAKQVSGMPSRPAIQLTTIRALQHIFFSTYPRPTAPRALPKPTAELRPRALAPDEVQGKPTLNGVKRKAESPRSMSPSTKRVARKLFA